MEHEGLQGRIQQSSSALHGSEGTWPDSEVQRKPRGSRFGRQAWAPALQAPVTWGSSGKETAPPPGRSYGCESPLWTSHPFHPARPMVEITWGEQYPTETRRSVGGCSTA